MGIIGLFWFIFKKQYEFLRSMAVGSTDSWQIFLQSAFILETKLIHTTSKQ